jgi:uncharacterized protein with von Willebrand factor type A (vWA) domain
MTVTGTGTPAGDVVRHQADEMLLGFARALRAAGLPVTADRSQTFLRATSVVDLGNHRATYLAGRATLCWSQEDFVLYDKVFAAWFLDDGPVPTARSRQQQPPLVQAPFDADADEEGSSEDDEVLRVAASDSEVLRHRDIATLDAAERARLAGLFGRLKPTPPRRVSYRRTSSRRGVVDTHETLRRTLTRMGEPVEIAWRHRSTRPRRTVLLVDISGSMSSYADALLRFAHRVSSTGPPGVTETFSVGTRVTRLTPAMRLYDTDRAMVAAGETVPDWSGGTRLGEGIKVFLDRWGQRGLARGAVVVVFSDGWERGDARLLGEQMARLHRLAHRVVWVNPHKGAAGYQPVQLGMAAALPHVDDFVAGHSLAAFEKVLEVVADA